MSESEVSVCNKALARLGLPPISLLTEGSRESITCGIFLEGSRDAALRDFKWNFATRRKVLAQLQTAVEPWGYCYAYPSDCIRAREIVKAAGASDAVLYEVAADGSGGRVILTDKAAAVLVYTARVTAFSAYDPLFVEAFSWKLAAEIALPLTADKNLMQIAETKYQNILSQARTADANEGEAETADSATWIEARLGYQRRRDVE